MSICGEKVKGDTVESWKERLPEILQNYTAENIWNMDETGCFWKALPENGLGQKGKACKGGKKSKHRFTVALFVNAAGGKEGIKPVVIWKLEAPCRCKGLDKGRLPVNYYSQSKSWMTGDIIHHVLQKINAQLKSQCRSILLLIDNAGCHPEDLLEKYSNIKVVFLPPNTTSVIQPLDLGIIKTFKVYYRKLLLQHIIDKIEECSTASEIVKSVNVLVAVRWVARAWESVSSDTINSLAAEGIYICPMNRLHIAVCSALCIYVKGTSPTLLESAFDTSASGLGIRHTRTKIWPFKHGS